QWATKGYRLGATSSGARNKPSTASGAEKKSGDSSLATACAPEWILDGRIGKNSITTEKVSLVTSVRPECLCTPIRILRQRQISALKYFFRRLRRECRPCR